MYITLVISSLSTGGAERVMSYMANYWASAGWSVTLITLSNSGSDYYAIDNRVKRIALDVEKNSYGIFHALFNNMKRMIYLRTTINNTKPDVIISFIDKTNILTLLAMLFSPVPVIISERTDPRYYSIGIIWHYLRILLYPKADALVIQSSELKNWAKNIIKKNNVYIIPNPVIAKCVPYRANNEFSKPFILAVGRLEIEKGFDLLLRSFWNISSHHPEWSLVVLGEGNERSRLEMLSKELGINDRVYFPGRHIDPHSIMRQASLFVLSSRYEGFPNVLLEAMACGLPSLSFNCPSGPNEIIRNSIDGILVPPENVDALSDAILDLIRNPIKRNKLSLRALEINDRFSIDKIMQKWSNLLIKLHEARG